MSLCRSSNPVSFFISTDIKTKVETSLVPCFKTNFFVFSFLLLRTKRFCIYFIYHIYRGIRLDLTIYINSSRKETFASAQPVVHLITCASWLLAFGCAYFG